MKKMVMVTYILLLLSTVAGCGSNNSMNSAISTVQPTTEPPIASSVPEVAQLPDVSALSAECVILYDLKSNQILYEKNATRRCDPAGLTALLAILTADANGGKDVQYTVGDEVSLIGNGSSLSFLQKGKKMPFDTMVDAVLVPSGNDAAYTLAVNIARHTSGKQLTTQEALDVFSEMMNETAEALGCTDSHFVAVDDSVNEQYSMAYDLLRVATAAANSSVIAPVIAKSQEAIGFPGGRKVVLEASNLLLKEDSEYYYKYATGMRSGDSREGHSLIASAEKDGTRLIAILLDVDGDVGRYQEAIALFEYGFEIVAND